MLTPEEQNLRHACLKTARGHGRIVIRYAAIIAICVYVLVHSTEIWLLFICDLLIVFSALGLLAAGVRMLLALASVHWLTSKSLDNEQSLRGGIDELEHYANSQKDE
jgi:hypothetical protein